MMDSSEAAARLRRKSRKQRVVWSVVALLVIAAFAYVKSHPLVFNESAWGHAHCIKLAGLELQNYAEANGGKFPTHSRGYGDALLLLSNDIDHALTGPGYDPAVFTRARQTGEVVPEKDCGRVYVQGLRSTDDPKIALLFDKLATPGGDHTSLPARMFAPLCREVWKLGGGLHVVLETEWPAYAEEQIQLLISAGIPEERARSYFSQ